MGAPIMPRGNPVRIRSNRHYCICPWDEPAGRAYVHWSRGSEKAPSGMRDVCRHESGDLPHPHRFNTFWA